MFHGILFSYSHLHFSTSTKSIHRKQKISKLFLYYLWCHFYFIYLIILFVINSIWTTENENKLIRLLNHFSTENGNCEPHCRFFYIRVKRKRNPTYIFIWNIYG